MKAQFETLKAQADQLTSNALMGMPDWDNATITN